MDMEVVSPRSDEASTDRIIASSSPSSSSFVPSRYPPMTDTKLRSTSDESAGAIDLDPLIGSKLKIPGIIDYRHQLAIYLFFGMTVVCAMRQTVSVAMAAMVNDSYVPHQGAVNVSREDIETCAGNSHPNSSQEDGGNNGEYNWDAHTQELLLAGFFYGYIITQIPGGWLSDRFGMKWVIGSGLLVSSVCTLLSPLAVKGGAAWYFVLRFCGGLGEGVSIPSMFAMWSKWAHPSERSRLSVIGLAGFDFGLFLGNILSGYLVGLDIAGGWPFPYYLFGSLGCVWFIVWCFGAYSTPDEHPWISDEERHYINNGLKHQDNKSTEAVPWGSLLLSPATWVLNIAQFTHSGVMFTLMVNLPLYYSVGIRLPLLQVGVYSALPFVAQLISLVVCGHISDRLLSSGLLSKLMTRKVMAATGFGTGGLCLLLAGFSRCSVGQAVTFITIAIAGMGPVFSGHMVALLDVSGRYAGSAMGIMNSCGSIGGIVGPYVVGVFTDVQSDIRGWQKVMWLLGAWYLLGGVVYVVFGTVELQPWARPKDTGSANGELKTRTKYGTTDSRNGFAEMNHFEEDDRP